MSRRDEEDRFRWAMQEREKAGARAEWLKGRADGGVAVKPNLERCSLESFRLHRFAGYDCEGGVVAPSGMRIEFRAAFGRKPNGYQDDESVVDQIEVRISLIGDPAIGWYYDKKIVSLSDAERAHIDRLIVSAAKERKAEASISTNARQHEEPVRYPSSDPRSDDYYSRANVEERIAERECGPDWYQKAWR